MVMTIVLSVALLLLGIGALVAIHVCLVGRALRGAGFETMGAEGGGGFGGRGLSPADLEKLPCYDYEAAGGEKGRSDGGGDCAVCLESFRMGDTCRLLPACRHSFHARCVDSWLVKRPICPVCRSVLGGGEGFGVRDENSTVGVSTASSPSSSTSHAHAIPLG